METIKKSEFRKLKNIKGKKIHENKYFFIIKKESEGSNFGLIIKKKTLNSVKRNRIRRLFKVHLKESKKKGSFLIIFKNNKINDLSKVEYQIKNKIEQMFY